MGCLRKPMFWWLPRPPLCNPLGGPFRGGGHSKGAQSRREGRRGRQHKGQRRGRGSAAAAGQGSRTRLLSSPGKQGLLLFTWRPCEGDDSWDRGLAVRGTRACEHALYLKQQRLHKQNPCLFPLAGLQTDLLILPHFNSQNYSLSLTT